VSILERRDAMSDSGQTLLAAVTNLRTVLEQAGDALATTHLSSMLDSEIALAAALAVLPSERGALDTDRDRVLQELVRARSALTRCRRLGASLTAMTRTSLGSQDAACCYRADGRYLGDAVGAMEARG
jgi:hypothetical protein